MSTLKTNAVQVGTSATATQNFTLRSNADGTATLARGNVGATTQDLLSVDAAGLVDFPVSMAIETPVKEALNASGDAPIFACRAWVNFNGTGTVAIRASGNVSSITDNGTGDYTVNFTTAMPDANYALSATAQMRTGEAAAAVVSMSTLTAPTAAAVRVRALNPTAFEDFAYVNVIIFR